jgi:hypothetical protein
MMDEDQFMTVYDFPEYADVCLFAVGKSIPVGSHFILLSFLARWAKKELGGEHE